MAGEDWETIHREWRTDALSNRALADKYDVKESTLRARAKREGWEKDLVDEYQKEVENQLLREVAQEDAHCAIKDDGQRKEDKEIVNEAARVGVEVVRQHRKRALMLNEIAGELSRRLHEELFPERFDPAEFKGTSGIIGERESHTDMAWKLTRVTSEVVKIERQAFNLDSKEKAKGEGQEIDIEERIQAHMRKTGVIN